MVYHCQMVLLSLSRRLVRFKWVLLDKIGREREFIDHKKAKRIVHLKSWIRRFSEEIEKKCSIVYETL